MNKRDKFLGLGNKITRRDFMQGVAGFSASLAVSKAFGEKKSTWLADETDYKIYPPGLTGLRGNHAGSFEAMHSLARHGNKSWPQAKTDSYKHYDLIVVGAGISGLSAAYYFKKDRPNAEVLILDNHDDFGGHAKRNEFQVDKNSLIGYGGAQTMQEPSGYSQIVKDLLTDLGVDFDVFYGAYDQNFFKDNNLRAGIFFDEKSWGSKTLVQYDLGCFDDFIPLKKNKLSAKEAVDEMPISEPGKGIIYIRLVIRNS
jgi:spermidine dehydrogenase